MLRIARFLACAYVQPPFLDQPWQEARWAIQEEMQKDPKLCVSAAAQSLGKQLQGGGDIAMTGEQLQMGADLLRGGPLDLVKDVHFNMIGKSLKLCDVTIGIIERELCHDIFDCNDPQDWENRREVYTWLFAKCEREKQTTFISVPIAFGEEEAVIMHLAQCMAKLDCLDFLDWAWVAFNRCFRGDLLQQKTEKASVQP